MKTPMQTLLLRCGPHVKVAALLAIVLGLLSGCASPSAYNQPNSGYADQWDYHPSSAMTFSYPMKYEWAGSYHEYDYFPSVWDWQDDSNGYGTAAAAPLPDAIYDLK